MKKYLNGLLYFSIALIVSCAPSDKAPSTGSGGGPAVKTAQIPDDAEKRFRYYSSRFLDAPLTCESDESCPRTIGHVATRMSVKHVGRCTGQLINEDVLLVSDHCIPDDIDGEDCARFLAFKPLYPEYEGQVAFCSKVLFTSSQKGYDGDFDFALIKLDQKMHIGPFPRISTAGIFENEKYKSFVINVKINKNVASLVVNKAECKAVSYTNFGNRGRAPFDSQFILAGCRMVQGNSGSAIYNASGEILGLVSAIHAPDSFDSINNSTNGKSRKDIVRLSKINFDATYVSNLACANLTAVGIPENPNCLAARKQIREDQRKWARDSEFQKSKITTEASFQQQLESVQKKLAAMYPFAQFEFLQTNVHYEPRTRVATVDIEPVLKCLKPGVRLAPFGILSQKLLKVFFTVPIVNVTLRRQADEYLRLSFYSDEVFVNGGYYFALTTQPDTSTQGNVQKFTLSKSVRPTLEELGAIQRVGMLYSVGFIAVGTSIPWCQ